MSYQAPLKDMRFVLNELAGMGEVAKLPGYEEATPDTVDASSRKPRSSLQKCLIL